MKKIWWLVVLMIAGASEASAQTDISPILNADVIAQRAGIALSGGNPVPGASSTLGMRLRAVPRFSVAGRVTGARMKVPDASTVDEGDELSSIARSLNVDVAIGIFSGFSLLPTVGGFGSLDLLGSYGKLSLSDDDGFVDDPTSWAAGVRVGILRESFTAPGIAVTGMYRSIGDFSQSVGAGGALDMENNRALNLRATVGKRLLMLGATAGVGYDKFYSDAEYTPPPAPGGLPVAVRNVRTDATTIFGNLSWTMLILNIVGEGGVQRADGESAAYGSLAVRIAL